MLKSKKRDVFSFGGGGGENEGKTKYNRKNEKHFCKAGN
jgi:hypothetical protein